MLVWTITAITRPKWDATIKAAKSRPISGIGDGAQPHRYTRTRDLYDDFANTLDQVDILLMLGCMPPVSRSSRADSRSLCRTTARRQPDPISGHRTGKIR